MQLIINTDLCYACKRCELICSYHHTGAFWPERSSLKIYRNQQNGYLQWSIDSTCDGCKGENEILCTKHCVYGALNPVA